MRASESPRRGLTLAELARHLGAEVEGDPQALVTGGAWSLADARPGDVVRVLDAKWLAAAEEGPAAAIIAPPGLSVQRKPVLRAANPPLALARAMSLFYAPARPQPGTHPSAVIGGGAEIPSDCTVMALCSVGAGVRLGRRVVLHPHVVLGDDVSVGDDTEIFAHVTIYAGTRIGARARIHGGAVIGADGFGYVPSGRQHVKIPQVGTVEIGDDVEIGANTTVDRASTGVTRIGAGTKIDNLVQIAHNVQVGENCIIVSQVGIAGSTVIEDNVVIAGQAGVNDHVRIGAGSVIAGGSGVFGDLPPGSYVSGLPARPHREALRAQAALQRLPELLRAVRALERRLRIEEGEGD